MIIIKHVASFYPKSNDETLKIIYIAVSLYILASVCGYLNVIVCASM